MDDAGSYDTKLDPTRIEYGGLAQAFDFFNTRLFGGCSPHCVITLQRHKGAYGFFCGKRFTSKNAEEIRDEIAINPAHILTRTMEQIFSTLVHEMVHLEQFHFGKPARNGYHNKEWASMMKAVGLHPSATHRPGGKETGQRMGDYPITNGPFAHNSAELIASGFSIRYGDRAINQAARTKKNASKTKYTCSGCGLNAWAKPAARLLCGDCSEILVPDGR